MLSTKNGLRYLLIAALLGVVALTTMGATVAAPPSKNCVGTYLVDSLDPFTNALQSQGLWTFAQGGTFQETDTAEDAFTFSHGQGVWKYANGVTKMTYLDFYVEGNPLPTSTARIDADLTFDNQCQDVTGTASLWFYSYPNDPLVANAGTFGGSFAVSGQQLTTAP